MTLVFDKCCGCIELRTGCLIIGYLNLVGELILIVMSCLGIIGGGVVTAQGEGKEQEVGAAVMVISIILLIFMLLFFLFTVLLLVGLHQNKRGHIKAYMIFTIIFLVLSILGWLGGFAAAEVNAVNVIRNFISIVISIYFLLVIRSYYIVMDDPAKCPAVFNTA